MSSLLQRSKQLPKQPSSAESMYVADSRGREVAIPAADRCRAVTGAQAKAMAWAARVLGPADTQPTREYMTDISAQQPAIKMAMPAMTGSVVPTHMTDIRRATAMQPEQILDPGLAHAAADPSEIYDAITRATQAEADAATDRAVAAVDAAQNQGGLTADEFFADAAQYGLMPQLTSPAIDQPTLSPDFSYHNFVEATAATPPAEDPTVAYARRMQSDLAADEVAVGFEQHSAGLDIEAIRRSILELHEGSR